MLEAHKSKKSSNYRSLKKINRFISVINKKEGASCITTHLLLRFAILSSGETGIRTPDTLLGYTRFPGVPLQPLEHLSFCPLVVACAKIKDIFISTNES